MKPRALLNVGLIVAVIVGLLWWLWKTTEPEVAPDPAKLAEKPIPQVTAARLQLPASVAEPEPVQVVELNNPTRTIETPTEVAAAPLPYVPDAMNTVPLADAERLMLTMNRGGNPRPMSILGFHHVLNGPRAGQERVDVHLWPNGPGPEMNVNTALSNFSPEDQEQIRNWARQQAAAAAANPMSPSPSADMPGYVRLAIEEGREPPATPPIMVGLPPSTPQQQEPKIITNQ